MEQTEIKRRSQRIAKNSSKQNTPAPTSSPSLPQSTKTPTSRPSSRPSSQSQMHPSFLSLPDDVLDVIAKKLPHESQVRLAQTTKSSRRVVQSNLNRSKPSIINDIKPSNIQTIKLLSDQNTLLYESQRYEEFSAIHNFNAFDLNKNSNRYSVNTIEKPHFSDNGEYVVSLSNNPSPHVIIIHSSNGKILRDLDTPREVVQIHQERAVRVSNNGKVAIKMEMEERTDRCWVYDVHANRWAVLEQERQPRETIQYVKMSFTPDGKYFIAPIITETEHDLYGDLKIHVWDASSGKRVRMLPIPIPARRGYSILKVSNNAIFANGALWDMFDTKKGSPSQSQLYARTANFLGAHFSPDNSQLYVSLLQKQDGHLQPHVDVWDVKTKTKLVSLPKFSYAYSATPFSSDGKVMVAVQTEFVTDSRGAEVMRKIIYAFDNDSVKKRDVYPKVLQQVSIMNADLSNVLVGNDKLITFDISVLKPGGSALMKVRTRVWPLPTRSA